MSEPSGHNESGASLEPWMSRRVSEFRGHTELGAPSCMMCRPAAKVQLTLRLRCRSEFTVPLRTTDLLWLHIYKAPIPGK